MAKRMFVALDLPLRVADTLGELDPHLPDLRWLPSPQLHLTLCFMAAVPDERIGPLIGRLERIKMQPFSLVLRGLASFDRCGQVMVVWAGIAHESADPFHLQSQVRAAAVAEKIHPERRAFHPHITVGRGRGISPTVLAPFLRRHVATDLGSFEVDGFTLYESELNAEGPRHAAVFHQPFPSAPVSHLSG